MGSRTHLWKGEWIDDLELEARIARIAGEVRDALASPPDTADVLAACERMSRRLREDASLSERLEAALREESESTTGALGEIADFLSRSNLELKLRRETGSSDPQALRRINAGEKWFESWAPLGFLVHIAPANAFSVGVLSAIEGLLTGNVNFVKTSGTSSLFAQIFFEEFLRDAPVALRQSLIIARLSSRRSDLLKIVLEESDGVSAWGGEEAIAAIRELSPPHSRFIEWGHKISFAYVARSRVESAPDWEGIARDVCLLDQQACSSPQCVLVEVDSDEELMSAGQRLADALARVSPDVPAHLASDAEAAEINRVTEVLRVEGCLRAAQVIEAPDRSWRVLVDSRPGLRASPLYRSIWLKPVDRSRIVETLRPLRAYLQTAGVAASRKELVEISRALTRSGVLRIRSPGRMLESYAGEPHDGVFALTRYLRRLSLESDSQLKGIQDFRQIDPKTTLYVPSRAKPILTKDAFQARAVDPSAADLFFKSGGSSGEPKLSVFTYDDYHRQMQLASDGLVAAGLDPSLDRSMNLFFGGGLYGGFLSFFTILEYLRAKQFPMAAHLDLPMVGKTIIDQRVNVLLGMPSYLGQLFDSNRELFARNRVVEKIFFGGEHFPEPQRRRFRDEFGIQVIRSASYGSVDAGPLGYQCPDCVGSIHHLHTALQGLEILALDRDEPAAVGEAGRMVFSSRCRSGQDLDRYDLGDLGRWIPGTCACGRTAPRFELLGRHGDIFRAGGSFLNYAKVARILSEEAGFDREMQLRIRRSGSRDLIEVALDSSSTTLDTEGMKRAILEHYPDLREIVREGTLEVEVRRVDSQSLERSVGSGKLLRLIDERKSGQ